MVLKDLYTIFIIGIKMTWMHPNTSEILQVLHKAMKCLRVDHNYPYEGNCDNGNCDKCLRVIVQVDHTTLIRVIVTRAEIDMKDIKAEYLKRYGKTLNDAVNLQTSGHYRNFLSSLLEDIE